MSTELPAVPAALLLFEHLADAVYLLDPQTSHIIWGNRAAWESLGLARDEVLDHSVLSLQMDVTGAPQWSEIAAVIRSAPCYTFVGRHRHAAGHEVAVEVNTTRFFDQGREYFLSVARDITRRMAFEGDLKKRENQLWFALNEAMDGLWDWDVASGAVYFSPQLKRMLGYGPDEMAPDLGTWSRNIHPDDAARVQHLLGAHLQGRRARYEAEYRLRTRNGQYLWVQDRGRVCERDAEGRPTRVVGMVQNVTQEREARAALQRSEQAQRTLIAALPDVIIRLDPEGRHLFVSPNISVLTTLPVSAMVGRTHAELGLPEDQCQYWAGLLAEVLRSGKAQESEFELDVPSRGAGRRVISCRAVPERDPQGLVCSVLAVCRDITQRRHAEAELARHRHHLEDLVAQRTAALTEAKVAAEVANRAKSRFLAHMSHELRTPLSAIIGMTTLARQRSGDPLVRDQLEKADQASHHLLGLISDILDLSKIEAERMALEKADFRLESVLGSLIHLAGHRAEQKGLTLCVDLPPGLATRALRGDPLRLKQILLNLVDNAIKFTARGGITVHVSVGPPGAAGMQALRFEVRDDGIGVDPEVSARLFQPFEQADNATTRRFGGSGLGLAISRELVQMMGGSIGVDSRIGGGSTFWFTLCLPTAAVAGTNGSVPAHGGARDTLRQQHAGRELLIADDDPVSRELLTELLRQAGLTVQASEDGDEALALAMQRPYALIVMDMQMPRMSGPEAVRRIRASGGPNAAVPIVALTANAFDDDRALCLAAGMNDYLTKPIDADRLYTAAASLLGAAR